MTTVETKLIESIKAIIGKDARPGVLLTGIGDDTAVLARPRHPLLFASDMLMEGTHFELTGTEPELIGRKALAVNLSDIVNKPNNQHFSMNIRPIRLSDIVQNPVV